MHTHVGPCPLGAYCSSKGEHTPLALPGFFPSPDEPYVFIACLSKQACQGQALGAVTTSLPIAARGNADASNGNDNSTNSNGGGSGGGGDGDGGSDSYSNDGGYGEAFVIGGFPDQAEAVAFGCKTGHGGFMCSECVQGYYKVKDLCFQCEESRWSDFFINLLFLLLGAGAVLGLMVKFNIEFALLDVLIQHLQTMGLFLQLDLGWNTAIRSALGLSSLVLVELDKLGLSCGTGRDGFLDAYYQSLSIPVAVCAVAVTAVLVYRLCNLVRWDITSRLASRHQRDVEYLVHSYFQMFMDVM